MKIKPILGMAILLSSSLVLSATHTITTTPSSIDKTSAGDFSFDVIHQTNDTANLTGFGMRMYYDSSVITFNTNTFVLVTNAIANDNSAQDDDNNEDGNANTDKYLGYSWANFSGAWAIDNPATLISSSFSWNNDSQQGSTTIILTNTSISSGYGAQFNNLVITGPFVGKPAIATNSTVEISNNDSINFEETKEFIITLKDEDSNTTNNLDGKTLSMSGSGSASFGEVNSNGVVIATYTPASIGTHSDIQFKLGSDNIGSTQTLEVTAVPRTLSITAPTNGSIHSSPIGISCGPDCSEEFLQGSIVTLTATADSGFVFASWDGECSGTTNPLSHTILTNTTCSVNFDIDTDGDGTANLTDDDDDGDGMPDTWENDNGLDPLVDDSDGDTDGDGRTNGDEYSNSTDPNADDVKPVFAALGDLTFDAKGKKTFFNNDSFGVSVEDHKDGALTAVAVQINDKQNSFSSNAVIITSGPHTITWKATDAAGNTATATQNIKVLPLVNFAVKQVTAEGQTPTISVFLSGLAPDYPVSVPFTISGSVDTDDYSVYASEITIGSGTIGIAAIGISTNGDDEKETLIVTMGTPTGAVKGRKDEHKIVILPGNSKPRIKNFNVVQGSVKGRIVESTATAVIVSANVFDPNGDSISYKWDSEELPISSQTETSSVSFNPEALEKKAYTIKLTASDGEFSVSRSIKIKVTAPVYLPIDNTDTDEDGIPDNVEGKGDTDGNGIPDYKEPPHEGYELPAGSGTSVVVPQGLKILVGVMGDDSGKLNTTKMQEYLDANGGITLANDSYSAGEIYDYKIEELPEFGATTTVVIQTSEMPTGTVLRKYILSANQWKAFDTSENDSYASARVESGASCPVGDSTDWGDNNMLTAGDNCLKIIIQDGGLNDADGEANASIEDPVAYATTNDATSSSSSGGGCAYNPNAPARFDMIFILLSVLGVYYLLRRRRNIITNGLFNR